MHGSMNDTDANVPNNNESGLTDFNLADHFSIPYTLSRFFVYTTVFFSSSFLLL